MITIKYEEMHKRLDAFERFCAMNDFLPSEWRDIPDHISTLCWWFKEFSESFPKLDKKVAETLSKVFDIQEEVGYLDPEYLEVIKSLTKEEWLEEDEIRAMFAEKEKAEETKKKPKKKSKP